MIDPAARVTATAELEEHVAIGPDTVVWDRAIVRRGARIGAGSTVGRDVLIDSGVSIGSNVHIHTGALVYVGATIDDDVYVGPRAILANDRYPRVVGPDGSPSGEHAAAGGSIHLGRGASIGAGSIVLAGCAIDRFATVGAGSVVTHHVPAHALVAGNPAHRIGWVCACGNRLADAQGNPAPAEVERYASDPFLACHRCERRYVYVPDHDTLEERRGPTVASRAAVSRQ